MNKASTDASASLPDKHWALLAVATFCIGLLLGEAHPIASDRSAAAAEAINFVYDDASTETIDLDVTALEGP